MIRAWLLRLVGEWSWRGRRAVCRVRGHLPALVNGRVKWCPRCYANLPAVALLALLCLQLATCGSVSTSAALTATDAAADVEQLGPVDGVGDSASPDTVARSEAPDTGNDATPDVDGPEPTDARAAELRAEVDAHDDASRESCSRVCRMPYGAICCLCHTAAGDTCCTNLGALGECCGQACK